MPMFLMILIGGAAIVDRWLKMQAMQGVYQAWPIGHFSLVRNDALVFSWPAPNWVATVLMGIVITAVVWYASRHWQQGAQRAPVLMVLLGATSNLYDRLVFGYVVDWGYLGPWWPIFNLADVMIAAGVLWWWLASRRLTPPHHEENEKR